MYSACVDDRATVACLLELQLTGPLFIMKTKPAADFLESLSPPENGPIEGVPRVRFSSLWVSSRAVRIQNPKQY